MNLKINHRLGVSNVDFFNSVDVTLKYDSVGSVFGFEMYLDPKNQDHAEMACVSHFHEAILQHEGNTLLTGYILSQGFKHSAVKQLVQFGGYSKAGVFEDCNWPIDLYPLQMDGLSLKQIATKVANRFKIKVIVDESVASVMNKAIPKTAIGETQTIKDYLAELATQQNVVISHDADGNLLFTMAKTNLKPLFKVGTGLIATDLDLQFNGQEIHSHITVVKQASSGGGNAGQYTIRNPYCPIVYRPVTKTQSSGDDVSIQKYAQQLLAAELKGITLTVEVDRWDVDGKLILPNNLITAYDPEVFLYKECDWFIEQVHFTGNEKEQKATLTCVLPECYNGKVPKNVFVDVHKNFPRISK